MKIKIMIAVAVLAILSVAAFVVSDQGTPVNAEEMERARGTEAYYADSEPMTAESPYGEDELIMHLDDGKIAKVAFNAEYRLGKEWVDSPEMATEIIMKKGVEMRSELILLVSRKKSPDLKGTNLLLFQEEVLKTLNDVVFPKKMARFEKILFKTILVQG